MPSATASSSGVAGEGAGDEFAFFGAVGEQAVGGEADGAGFDGFADEAAHVGELFVGGLDIFRAALAHDVGAEGAVGELGDDVHDAGFVVDGVEVFGEGFPFPGDAG